MNPVTPEQVLEFSKFPQFRRLVAQLINEEGDWSTYCAAGATAQAIRTMIELKDMLES